MGIWDKFYERAQSFFKQSDEAGGSAQPKSRCYYDLLEVSRDATEDEIKRSFKRLALQWHPDKNPDRAEECTAYFVLIQQAYEVLIDPQERAFYDRHRENIIYQQHQTDSSGAGAERCDTGINLEPYMSTACFRQGGGVAASFVGGLFSAAAMATGTAASPRSGAVMETAGLSEQEQDQFFTVYRDLFHKLAAEEYAYIADPEERNFPVFGKATSDYDTVVAPFYAFWLDFTTRRSFAWLDKWNLRKATDRTEARAMEKENRKLREQGRKQRSEQVRKVVEFVRRCDVRVQRAKERQRERNARIHQIVEEQRRQTIRRNLENMPTFEQDEEAQRQHLAHLEEIERALDAEFGTGEAADGPNSEGDENDDGAGVAGTNKFRCIVCEKSFNTKNVLVNHQRSKKHRQMVELLRVHMRAEDQQLFFVGEEGERLQQQEDGVEEESGGGREAKSGRETAVAEEEEEEDDTSSNGQGRRTGKKKKKRQRKQQRAAAAAARRLEEVEKDQPQPEHQREKDEREGEEARVCAIVEEKENSNNNNNKRKKDEKEEKEGDETVAMEKEADNGQREKTTKKKSDRRAEQQQQKTVAGREEQQQQQGPVHCECTTCGGEFESKTKLHAHLRSSGHAALKTMADKIATTAAADSATDGGGRRRRKKK